MPTMEVNPKQVVVIREYTGDAATEVLRAELEAADTALQAGLDAEEATRIAQGSSLQSQIDEVEAESLAADTALQAGLDAEEATRTEEVGLINLALAKILGAVSFKAHHDEKGNHYLFSILSGTKVGFGITSKLKMIWAGNQIVMDRVFGIKDAAGQYALAVTKAGKVYIPHLVMPAWVTAYLTNLTSQLASEESARVSGDLANQQANSETSSAFSSFSSNFILKTGIHDDHGNAYVLALVNRTTGKLAWGITSKAHLMLKSLKLKAINHPLMVLDAKGLAALVITKGGSAYIPNLILGPKQLAQIPSPNAEPVTLEFRNFVPADRNHIVFDGQSLSIGVATVSAISLTQPYSNLTLASGPTRGFGDGSYNPNAEIPLVEANSVESPVSGAANSFVRRIASVGGNPSQHVMFGTSSGDGGKTVLQLTDEALYIRLRRHIADAKALAVAAGKSYGVCAIVWIQGEADIVSNITWARSITYYKNYLALMTKIRETALEFSDQGYLPSVYSYQTAAHSFYNKRYLGVAVAQWRASVENKDIVLAAPAYCLPHAADNLHLSNEGSWLLGEYVGRAMFWTMVKGQKWRPLEPVDVTWGSSYIDIKYHVPCKPIQLSTLICSAATNQGFDIWNDGSNYDSASSSPDDSVIADAINNVTVLSEDTIRVHLNPAATIPANAVLCYGRGRSGDPQVAGPVAGARGNVLDSHGIYDIVASPLGNNFPLYNVGVYFQYSRKDGFF